MSNRIQQWFHHEAAGGVILVCAAALAMIVANSPLQHMYQSFLQLPVSVQLGNFLIDKPLVLWVNDGLMALFFFLIGLEIKKEVLIGHLQTKEQIILPALAAVAGIAFPAAFYVLFNYGDAVAMQGWAVPAATDIAFALGIYLLVGRALPVTLKLFLLSVAIFDDIGAIVIIALFYSSDLSNTSLVLATIGLACLFALNRSGVKNAAPYVLVSLFVWAAVLKSGVHATLAGFAVAWFVPLGSKAEDDSMATRFEQGLHPWVMLLVLPLFAFANAGVSLSGFTLDSLFNPIVLGIVAGLFVGKQIGIFAVCWLAIKSGLAKIPEGANWKQLYAVCVLCGIGFTMSLFIGTLAFEGQAAMYTEQVKLGVLLGSLFSAVLGTTLLWKGKAEQKQTYQLPQLDSAAPSK